MLSFFVVWLMVGAVLSSPASRAIPEFHEHGDATGKFPRDLEKEEDYVAPPARPSQQHLPGVRPHIDIFPPKNNPGEIFDKIEHGAVDNALDEVMKAGSMLQDRRCAIGIVNEGQKTFLSNPQWAFYSGQIHTAMPYQLPPQKTSLNLFVKTTGLASGTVGVASYDIDGTDHKLVVMWSVPFDFNVWDLWFNMKVLPKSVPTNRDLWAHMYYDAGAWQPNSWRSRTEFGVTLRGVMTDHYHSKFIVWINADQLDPTSGYELFTDCAYHPGKVRKYCTQEKFPADGWCWVNKKCSHPSECVGRHSCM